MSCLCVSCVVVCDTYCVVFYVVFPMVPFSLNCPFFDWPFGILLHLPFMYTHGNYVTNTSYLGNDHV